MPHKTKGDANGTMPHGMFFGRLGRGRGRRDGEGGEGASRGRGSRPWIGNDRELNHVEPDPKLARNS